MRIPAHPSTDLIGLSLATLSDGGERATDADPEAAALEEDPHRGWVQA